MVKINLLWASVYGYSHKCHLTQSVFLCSCTTFLIKLTKVVPDVTSIWFAAGSKLQIHKVAAS